MRRENIVVGNLPEAFIDLLNKDPDNKSALFGIELTLDEQAALWEGNNSLVVASHTIHPAHMRHLQKALGYNNIEVLVPRHISGRLSADIVEDRDLFSEIASITHADSKITHVTPYCVTPEFVNLVNNLVGYGSKITTPEVPDKENLWTVKSIDLKSGFRKVCSGLLEGSPIQIPRGVFCDKPDQMIAIAHFFSKEGTPCIIKPDDGEDGIGQVVIPPGSDLNYILDTINKNPFIRNGNAVVEEYIEVDAQIASPSIEYRIKGEEIEYLYSCRQVVSPNRTFLGVDVGPEVLPQRVKTQMLQSGNAFARVLMQLGYRGFFDIDFIMSKGQKLYAVEANLRRTGATHVHSIGKRLFGSDYESQILLRSSDVDPCITSSMSCEEALLRLDEILYLNLGSDKGIIITVSAGIKEGRLGYIIIGKSPKEIVDLQEDLHKRLS